MVTTGFLYIHKEQLHTNVLAGHSHRDEYRLSYLQSDGVPAAILGTPAVSPLFGNNPAFKVLTLASGDWKLTDYRSLNYDLDDADPAFRTFYTFSRAYGMEPPLQPALAALYPELAAEETQRQAYTHFYYSGHDAAGRKSEITETSWPAYWCGISTMDKDDYMTCVNSYR